MQRFNSLNFILANARSLPSKMTSLTDSIKELDLHFAVITETWLKTNRETAAELREIEDGESISIISKNRKGRGGGVAVAFNQNKISLKKYIIPGNKYEMVCGAGKTIDDVRKIAVFAVYIPPSQKAETTKNQMNCLADCIEMVKLEMNDPYIIVAGDFNKRRISALDDFPDLAIIQTPATRRGAVLDVAATNIDGHLTADIRDPLENEVGQKSDHSVVHIEALLPRLHQYVKTEFFVRKYTDEAEQQFGDLLLSQDWAGINQVSASRAAEDLNVILQEMYNKCFPLKKRISRSSDAPWITKRIRRMIRNRKRIYKKYGRCDLWRRKKTMVEIEILDSKRRYFEKIKQNVLDNNRAYFQTVKLFGCREAPKRWMVQGLYPGWTDFQIAEEAANYFNSISQEYRNGRGPIFNTATAKPTPAMYEIAAALKSCKKPKSVVNGDIDRRLVTKYSDILAIPLWTVYNLVFTTLEWPALWATETVHLIPKTSNPDGLKQLRNISCTPLFSKVLEGFILSSLKASTKLSTNQFGGIKGSSVEHFLVETWDEIMMSLEDHRASVQLMSIDFEKAFNRMDHGSCLAALERLGADPGDIELVSAFLYNRTMQVKVGQSYSNRRSVPGGSPQGSILGNFLFCATTDVFNSITLAPSGGGEVEEVVVAQLDPSGQESDNEEVTFYESDQEEASFRFFRPTTRCDFLNDTEQSFLMSQSGIDSILGVPDKWESFPAVIKAYVDDINIIEKVRHSDAVSVISQNKQKTASHARQSQELFKKISEEAAIMKMKVNESKTQIVCISAATSMSVSSYINAQNNRIFSGGSLKILGFWFDSRPGVSLHIEKLEEKFRGRLWSLRHLKRSGMPAADLLFIFKSILRPVIDFACIVYHPMLTKGQAERIELLQKRALKIIFGPYESYSEIVSKNSIETLAERRERFFVNFTIKASNNDRVSQKWFPLERAAPYGLRNQNKYLEMPASTDRLYNSPLFQMRKRLNNL